MSLITPPEEVARIEALKDEYLPRIIKCLVTKPYIEGLNEAHKVLLEAFDYREGIHLRPLHWVLLFLLEWFKEFIKTFHFAKEEDRRMRIKQCIVFCFYLTEINLGCGDFRTAVFENYVLPHFVKPGLEKGEISANIWRTIYELCIVDVAEDMNDEFVCLYFTAYDYQLWKLMRGIYYDGTPLFGRSPEVSRIIYRIMRYLPDSS